MSDSLEINDNFAQNDALFDADMPLLLYVFDLKASTWGIWNTIKKKLNWHNVDDIIKTLATSQ